MKNIPLTLPYLDGLVLATNAISDAHLIIDGYNCHYEKVSKICGNHDLNSTLLNYSGEHRVITTNLASVDLVNGSYEKLSRAIKDKCNNLKMKLLIIAPSNIIQASGQTIETLQNATLGNLNSTIIQTSSNLFTSDWLDGYQELQYLTAQKIEKKKTAITTGKSQKTNKKNPKVSILGNLFLRNELDEIANTNEIKNLLNLIGIDVESNWLSGQPFSYYNEGIQKSDALLTFPFGLKVAETINSCLDIPFFETQIPLGISGTVNWLNQVGQFLSINQKLINSVIEKEIRRIAPIIAHPINSYLAGHQAVLFIDPYHAYPMVKFLEELGISTKLLVLNSRHKPSQQLFDSIDSTDIIWDPYFNELKNKVNHLFENDELFLAIGNSTLKGIIDGKKAAFIEFGIPSYQYHCMHPSPYLGFKGATHFIQRLTNKIIEN